MQSKIFIALLPILVLSLSCLQPQQQEKLNFKDMGYGHPGLFVYEVKQFDTSGAITKVDTLGLFCSSRAVPYADHQNWMEWQYVHLQPSGKYETDYHNYVNETTGIWSDDTVLFIHPPRFSYFKILQFCPYPYFKRDSSSWSWDLDVGALWAIEKLYPIKTTDRFVTTYRRASPRHITTPLGNLFCDHITASNNSRYGTSYADYYLNSHSGIVFYTIYAVNKLRFDFTLLQTLHKPDSVQAANKTFKPQRDADFQQLAKPGN